MFLVLTIRVSAISEAFVLHSPSPKKGKRIGLIRLPKNEVFKKKKGNEEKSFTER